MALLSGPALVSAWWGRVLEMGYRLGLSRAEMLDGDNAVGPCELSRRHRAALDVTVGPVADLRATVFNALRAEGSAAVGRSDLYPDLFEPEPGAAGSNTIRAQSPEETKKRVMELNRQIQARDRKARAQTDPTPSTDA